MIAHNLNSKIYRSHDVRLSDSYFGDFNLDDKLLLGLKKSGFSKPSEIQLRSIPLGRLGMDLFVNSKSGTGKTCVFGVIVLDTIDINIKTCQSLILAPTHEIANQIYDVFNSIGQYMNFKIGKFIGGLDIKKDIKKAQTCQVAIGTPGRINYLIQSNYLPTQSIRILILDEADKLFDNKFESQVNLIIVQLPSAKQTIVVSATSTSSLSNFIKVSMRNAQKICVEYDSLCLEAVKQYYWDVGLFPVENYEQNIFSKVLQILKVVPFKQCIIFSNSDFKTDFIKNKLKLENYSTEMICGNYTQKKRDEVINMLKKHYIDILISTDLISRGLDNANVNLVINLDVPSDLETYLHRVGRCGRFGQEGTSITICARLNDSNNLYEIKKIVKDNLIEIKDLSIFEDMNSEFVSYTGPNFTIEDLFSGPEECPNSRYLSFRQLKADYEEFLKNYDAENK